MERIEEDEGEKRKEGGRIEEKCVMTITTFSVPTPQIRRRRVNTLLTKCI